MDIRLLIINAPSPYFLYIPMGTFGVCDFLEQQNKLNISSKILNPALYPEKTISETIAHHISSFKPTHIAIVCHWQETVHGLLQSLETITKYNQSLPIIVGGFTASFFAKDLLHTYPAIDYIIKGDPELPLLHLFSGKDVRKIPNLISRNSDNFFQTSEKQWVIEKPLLDKISFSRLEFLYDSAKYIEKIESILGFPLFLGRGCIFNCQYCGGSRQAFNLHSYRSFPVTRSIEAVLKDLHLLKEKTDTLYICYENDRKYILSLFNAISNDSSLRGHFTLNYGAWHLIDQDFIDLYKKAFYTKGKRPVFEFSPEVISNTSRKQIKGSASYPLIDLLDNCTFIDEQFNGRIRTELFFSRYHPTASTIKSLLKEIEGIYKLKHDFFLNKLFSVNICYDHLSTDVASKYWQEHLSSFYNFNTFLSQKSSLDQKKLYSFPIDNLCFYIPDDLIEKDCILFETLAFYLENIEKKCHELFHILFACIGEKWIGELYKILIEHYNDTTNNFDTTLLPSIIDEVVEQIIKNTPPSLPLTFLKDLASFSTAKITPRLPVTTKDNFLKTDELYILNQERISINQYNYINLHGFISLLEQQHYNLSGYQRTVFIYLDDDILSLPHKSYRVLLQPFEKKLSINGYFSKQNNSISKNSTQLLSKENLQNLINSDVLQPALLNT